jgi:putative addiction module component (TIGR02574 family)
MPDVARVKTVETEALSLPEKDRADLARVLLLSLGDEGREPDAEAAWVDEAERRFEELESGAAAAIPSDQVFEEARSRLK